MKLHVKHILVQHKYEAEDILKKLQSGQSFEELAMKHSTCPSAPQGGDLGPVSANRLDSDFAETAESLQKDQISPIVRTRFGYHLIKRIS